MSRNSAVVINIGASTELEFDFTDYVFRSGEKVVFSVKNPKDQTVIYGHDFTTAEKIVLTIDTSTAEWLDIAGYALTTYDLISVVGDEKTPLCDGSLVRLVKVVPYD